MEEARLPAPLPDARRRILWRPHDIWFIALAVLVVALDQLTKRLLAASLERGDAWPSQDWAVRLVHFTNSGAAFGIFQGAGPLLAFTSVIGVIAVIVYLVNPGFADPLMRAGLALMLGGAVGNLIDRVSTGEVVDFIKFPHWPAFNVADSSITIGVLTLLWAITRQSDPGPASGS